MDRKNRLPKLRVGSCALLAAALIGFTTADAARAGLNHRRSILHGAAARKAVERALLPFIMQYRTIKAIHFVAYRNQNDGTAAAAFPILPPRITLVGIYKFWADGDRYRIGSRVLKSNYQPIMRQIWTFNGRRYESQIGSNGDIDVSHHRDIGGMPGARNPVLRPIMDLCWRATARQPVNWRRVKRFPRAVDALPATINIGYYKRAGNIIEFSDNYGGLRWATKWQRSFPPPSSFRPGRKIWSIFTLKRRGSIWLPVSECLEHAQIVNGRRAGSYYTYTAVPVKGGVIYLPRTELHVGAVTVKSMQIEHLRVNGRIDPAEFTINFGRASAYFMRDRIINISRLPAAPARSQHFGSGGKPAGKQ
jgi:hypothetical protein